MIIEEQINNETIIKDIFSWYGIDIRNAIFNIGVNPTLATYIFATPSTLNDIYHKDRKHWLELKNALLIALDVQVIRMVVKDNITSIEVPNKERALVNLADELLSETYKNFESGLIIPFGRDGFNNSHFYDLRKLPHLLMAGATGSGKSTFLNTSIISLTKKHSPKELNIILSDVKKVEFDAFQELPHLLRPIINDHDQINEAFAWCDLEVNNRLKIFSDCQVNNIDEYHKKQIMPYIVFIIDEISDYIVFDAYHGKKLLAMILKVMDRAEQVGIHLIINSSRPCEETFPIDLRNKFLSRLVFVTAGESDSKIALGQGGAQSLLSKGDALFRYRNADDPIRLQLPYSKS
ncbi:MAG: hypothetical protein COX77_00645 [Candidatus Komeilibacteria bacterium CG_4_10_14_0_2_um_filter_37_10]|uniref:FtsK domain-containing protein n=1 Tax=Candidatus Komeilibacteria bacterium CG_4_10_14_0_2_um_filter_37_10 TaxID=1974470 RepID=A0A2M7VG95_9BACT|nr:MAG: hypothetical protein COX77_00645 [Candidatus Komeilibacteria bacterium CG_4_10_14_0_2_um_filter_37_10]